MASSETFDLEGSVAQRENENETESDGDREVVVDVRGASWQATCGECGGQIRQVKNESVCSDCGLVVAVETLDRSPTMVDHAPDNADRVGEWSCEPTNQLRVDKGLHTTFFLSADGKGNTLTPKQKDRMERLRRRHKRFTMHDKRDQRLNEGMRDIGMLGANLGLPEHVQTDAAQFLKAAKRERLPCGRMAWESLAAGAMVLATRRAGIERSAADVAEYAKSRRERVCAAARKIRVKTDVEAPPVRQRCVDEVLAVLGDDGLDVETSLALARVADRLMDVADREPIGPGTPRVTVAGAAVYAADRFTDGKAVTQQEVADAASEVVPMSQSKIADYSRRLYDAADAGLQPDDAVAGLIQAD